MTNIILCGGNGTRLWPLSRTLMPKQFSKLFDDRSLFQMTVQRNSTTCSETVVVSNAEQYFLAMDQLEEFHGHAESGVPYVTHYLLEPVGRNTAPAIALACLELEKEDVVLVCPSDHLIKNQEAYEKVVLQAKKFAQDGHLVTFGIKPSYPETGYGYIKAREQSSECGVQGSGLDVECFREKPDLATAEQYLEINSEYGARNSEPVYFWNSGMFCFQAGTYLEELKQYAPEIYDASAAAFQNATKDGMIRIKHEDMVAIPDESIDYAVMEKSRKVKVVPCDIGWSDVGSFDSLDAELPKDENGNTLMKKLYTVDARNNFVYSKNRSIALADVEDLIVVDTGDALLVTKKGSSQKVKEVVSKLRSDPENELHHIHLTAHRPWGTYTVLENRERYKIKRIIVKPGKRLSLQKHFHRSEHWIVVSGTALVTVGEKEILVRPNESTYIPMGEVHRLENQGKIDLVLIEAQVGEYTGEDDIVRIQDDFKRC